MREIQKTVDINAHITNIECKVSGDGDFSKAVISFDNLGYGIITAVKFNAQGYNSFGDTVQINGKDKFFLVIQDIRIDKNSRAAELKARIPSGDIRKLDLEECQICYADGSVSTYNGEDNREFAIQQFDGHGEEKDTLCAIKDKLGDKIQYQPQEVDCGWICGCGRYNKSEDTVCSNCNNAKAEVFKTIDAEYIAALVDEHKRKEEERRERARQEEIQKQKEQKKRNIKIGIGVVVAIALVILVGHAAIMAGRTTYASEAEMKEDLQGTYTYYNDSGKASRQIVISGDNVTYKWSYGSDMDTTVKEWNYKKGIVHTFEDIIVTSDGNLKSDGDLYKKGGYMSTGNSYSNTYAGNSYSNTSSYESAYSVLKFSDLKVSSNSSYTICTGTLKNTGTKTYNFVEVKGAFKDSAGNVIDTDWTYAVGSEGLAPGEATTFRMSVTKNSKITSCSVSIIDYN